MTAESRPGRLIRFVAKGARLGVLQRAHFGGLTHSEKQADILNMSSEDLAEAIHQESLEKNGKTL